MVGDWILLIGIVLTGGGFLVGFWRADGNSGYEPVVTKYAIWTGLALLLIRLIFFFNWRGLWGL